MPSHHRLTLAAAALSLLAAAAAAQCVDYTDLAHVVGRATMPFTVRDLEIDGDLAYATTYGGGLVVLDIGDPTDPHPIGSVDLAGSPQYVVARGSILFATGHGSAPDVYAVDVSSPSSPTQIGYLAMPDGTQIAACHGDLLLVQRHLADLIDVVDATDPTNLSVLSTFHADGQSILSGGGDLVYIRTRYRLEVWDLSDPAWPAQRGYVDLSNDYPATSMARYGTSLLLAADGAVDRVTVVDVSDPDAPAHAGYFQTRYGASSVVVDGDQAHVALYSGAVDIFDLSDLADVAYLGSMVGGGATDIALSGQHLVCADQTVISVFDVTGAHLAYPETGFHDWVYGFSFSAERKADHVYVGGQFGLFAFDVADYTAPVATTIANSGADVAMSGDILYATNSHRLIVYDLADPATPAEINALERPWWSSSPTIHVAGDLLVVDTADSLITFDITDPASPQPLGGRPFATFIVDIEGDLLYALTDSALHILDLADPVNLPQLGQTPQPDGESLAVSGDHAYVCNSAYNELLWVLDVSDPTAPAFAASHEGIYIRGLSVHGNQLLATQGGWGVQLLDLADPVNPTYSGHLYRGYDTGWVYRAKVVGDLVWLGRDDGVGFIPAPCVDDLTPVVDEPVAAPPQFRMSSHPNPFNPQVTIRYELPRSGLVSMDVFDLRGRRVRRLVSGEEREAGMHSVTWRGDDDSGRALASGIYLARLQSGDRHATRKLVLAR